MEMKPFFTVGDDDELKTWEEFKLWNAQQLYHVLVDTAV